MANQTKIFDCQHCGEPNAVTVSVTLAASVKATPAPLHSPNQGLVIRVVVEFVANRYGLAVHILKHRSREDRLVLPRQICVWLLVTYYGCTLIEAARAVGREDPSTASHALARIQTRRERLASFREETDSLAAAITQRIAPRPRRLTAPRQHASVADTTTEASRE